MSEPTASVPNPYAPPQPAADVPPPLPAEGLPLDAEIRSLFDRGKNGAGWFYWIAGLSLFNTLAMLTGSGTTFAVGLGVTMIADVIAVRAARNGGSNIALGVALAFDLIVYALVLGCGWLSRKRVLPVFAIGMVLYLLDGILCLLLGRSVICIGIHALALFNMWSGFTAYRKLNELERSMLLSAAGAP
jgi:hypothetical protein